MCFFPADGITKGIYTAFAILRMSRNRKTFFDYFVNEFPTSRFLTANRGLQICKSFFFSRRLSINFGLRYEGCENLKKILAGCSKFSMNLK